MKKRKRLGISEIPKFSFLYIVCIVVSTTVSSSEKETRHNSRRDRYIFLQPWRCLLRKATEQSSIMVRKLHIPFWYWKKTGASSFSQRFYQQWCQCWNVWSCGTRGLKGWLTKRDRACLFSKGNYFLLYTEKWRQVWPEKKKLLMRFSSSSSSVNNESFRDNCGGFNLSFFLFHLYRSNLLYFRGNGDPKKLDLFSGAQKFLVSFYSPNKMQGDFLGDLENS